MRLYESVLIARQDVSAAQVESLTDEFAGIIENGGGSIKKREYWGLKSLAYRIKKNRKGHYVLLNIEADSATLNEYERIMGLNEDILRFMTIRIEEVDEEPSIMMQAKTERSERGDRRPRPEAKAEGNAPASEEA
jgi:small subunit ribosomal protein S6